MKITDRIVGTIRLLPYTLPLWACSLTGQDASEEPIVPRPAGLEDYDFTSEFIKMMSTLGIMVLALLLIAWFLKRVTKARMDQVNTTSDIKVLERRILGPKAAVYLLDVRGKGILISESPAGMHHLGNVILDDSRASFADYEEAARQTTTSDREV